MSKAQRYFKIQFLLRILLQNECQVSDYTMTSTFFVFCYEHINDSFKIHLRLSDSIIRSGTLLQSNVQGMFLAEYLQRLTVKEIIMNKDVMKI